MRKEIENIVWHQIDLLNKFQFASYRIGHMKGIAIAILITLLEIRPRSTAFI